MKMRTPGAKTFPACASDFLAAAGRVLGIFPAGTVSSFSLAHKRVTDDPWNANIAAIIRMTKATVVPVYFPGRNSLLFQGHFPDQPQGARGVPSP